ncbi:MAG: hypothetical protein LR017_01440 [Candidatus Pacebacteria bacterium]|nr:hypothetical protein [Candidatus Paceibacterota bacterium]
MKQKILPAIIPKTFEHLKETLKVVEPFAEAVQIDVVDGKFVPFTSWPYGAGEDIAQLAEITEKFDVEIDLMIEHPEEVIAAYYGAGVERMVVHLESVKDEAAIETILEHHAAHNYGLGFSINNDTLLEELIQYLDRIDFVQLMGIAQIGSQGQPFDERVIDRIKTLLAAHPDLQISIDGSVNKDTLPRLYEAGAQHFVSGSAILKASDPQEVYREFDYLVRF